MVYALNLTMLGQSNHAFHVRKNNSVFFVFDLENPNNLFTVRICGIISNAIEKSEA